MGSISSRHKSENTHTQRYEKTYPLLDDDTTKCNDYKSIPFRDDSVKTFDKKECSNSRKIDNMMQIAMKNQNFNSALVLLEKGASPVTLSQLDVKLLFAMNEKNGTEFNRRYLPCYSECTIKNYIEPQWLENILSKIVDKRIWSYQLCGQFSNVIDLCKSLGKDNTTHAFLKLMRWNFFNTQFSHCSTYWVENKKKYEQTIEELLIIGADVNVNDGEAFLKAIEQRKRSIMLILLKQPNIQTNASQFQKAMSLMIEKEDWPDCSEKWANLSL